MKGLPIKSFLKKRDESGFTLIEMSIVLVIIGVIISIMATTLPTLLKTAKIKKGRAEIEKLDYSLEGYLISNGRFPCPDTDGDGLENRIVGSNPPLDDTCSTYVGDLPYLTLGLSNAKDPWQNAIKYGIYEDLIKSTGGSESSSYCNVLKGVAPSPADTGKIYTTSSTGIDRNQAYIIVSGGPKDYDGTGGFFDDRNGNADPLDFEAPDRIVADYDDIVRAVSFVYLAGRECVGTESGGVLGGGGENTFPNGCANDPIDDDGDGAIDCDDSDCSTDIACVTANSVNIIASPLPAGYINSSYSAGIDAVGGTVPYEWELLSNGGFTDFAISTYSGVISGTLNQCPGTYAIQVKVTDTSNPVTTDTETFNITVNKNISIAGNSTITWDNPEHEEVYSLTGSYLGGSINWTLTGAPTGFVLVSSGNDSAILKKNGATTAGTYNFTITATDSDCSTNTVNKNLTVTVTASGAGVPLSNYLVGKWNLDECSWDGTTGEVKDSGENILDGTAINGANTSAAGKLCYGGAFDGINDRVEVPDDTELQLATPLSLSLWVKVANAFNGILAEKGSFFKNYSLQLRFTGQVRFRINNVNLTTAVTVNDDAWHHVVGVYDGATMKIYVDKVESATVDYTVTPTTSSDPFYIGYGNVFGRSFELDEVALYFKALSVAEIERVYDATRTCGTCP